MIYTTSSLFIHIIIVSFPFFVIYHLLYSSYLSVTGDHEYRQDIVRYENTLIWNQQTIKFS